MAGLRLAIDPTGMTSGARKAEDALDDVKRKAGETEKATDRVGGQFRKTGNEAKNAAPKVDTVGRSLSNFTGMAVKAGAALAALGVGLSAGMAFRRFVSATVEADAAQAQLSAAITSTGGAAGRSIADLNRHAAELQRLTSFGDDTTNAMQGLLLTFTNIQGGTFDRATVAVQDLATAMGKDLSSSALQVGKALNDPVLGMSALAESGIQFSKAQKEAVKAMVETNDIAGAQAVILAELERQFGGSAEAARNTLGGALNALGNAWGDVFEIGSDASEGLRQSVESLVDTVSDPAFVSSIQAIGSAMFSAAEIAARSLSFVVENADILGTSLALLAARSLPGVVTGLYALATGAGAAGAAAGALAFAMNAIPLVAIATGATLVYRAFKDSKQAAADLQASIDTLTVAQDGLNEATTRFYEDVSQANLQAMRLAAESNLQAVKDSMAAAQEALESAQFKTNFFGVSLYETEEITAAQAAIVKLSGKLVEAEARLAAVDHAQSNLGATSGDTAASIGKITDATFQAVPSLAELSQKYGELAPVIRDAITSQNELAIASDGAALSGAISGVASLAEGLGLGADKAALFRQDLQRLQGMDTFAAQARGALELAAYIERTSGGVQNMTDETRQAYRALLDAAQKAGDLAIASGQISFSGAVSSAQALAAQLGISVALAQQLSRVQAGGSAGDVNHNGLDTLDPRNPNSTRPIFDGPTGTVSPFDPSRIPKVKVGGDAGGGGGGSAQVDRTKEAYDALMASLDPAVAASQRLAKAQETINAAMQTGNITAEDAADAYSLAQEAFDKATSSIGAGTNVWKTFQDAGANAIDRLIDGTGNLKDALIDMLKQMALAIANKRILENGGTEVSSLGGLIFNAFAGLFDAGGTIPYGQTGIVGERGPELVKSTPMGTVVTSRQDTARRLSRQQSGGMTFNIDARGAQQGVAEQIRDALKTAAPQIAQSGAAQAIQTVKTNWGTFQQQQETDGQVV